MIPNKRRKMFAPVVADIYNVSMQQGVFPQRLKRAIVRPIPKQSPPTSIEDDLRPISNIPGVETFGRFYFKIVVVASC